VLRLRDGNSPRVSSHIKPKGILTTCRPLSERQLRQDDSGEWLARVADY